jgi:hypothetical protein
MLWLCKEGSSRNPQSKAFHKSLRHPTAFSRSVLSFCVGVCHCNVPRRRSPGSVAWRVSITREPGDPTMILRYIKLLSLFGANQSSSPTSHPPKAPWELGQVMENLIRISKRRRFEFPKNTVGSRTDICHILSYLVISCQPGIQILMPFTFGWQPAKR